MARECHRCDAKVEDVGDHETHLIASHAMGTLQAKREAKDHWHDVPQREPDARYGGTIATEADHVCAKCGHAVVCDWKSINDLEHQANTLKRVAGMWRAKLAGQQIGRPRSFDYDKARELAASGMSKADIAKALGVDKQAIYTALNPNKNQPRLPTPADEKPASAVGVMQGKNGGRH